MKKKDKHKWKYRIDVRKKILVLVILGVLLFVGIGYAILEANLGIGGTLEVKKYDKTLYGVFPREERNGYALTYTGEHQDSMDASKSTKNIYYFYGGPTTGADIQNKNNVLFADHCWQMIRTTDTGGVKLLYNGDPEITVVDGVNQYNCGNTRNLYHIGTLKEQIGLYGTYKYAKNYTASTNGSTTTFTLVDDPDDPDDYKSISINNSNIQSLLPDIIENYPYTCRNSSGTCTNDAFYKIESFYQDAKANAYVSSYRDSIGINKYNTASNSPSYVGYMYGDVYEYHSDFIGTTSETLTQDVNMLASGTFPNTYKFSQTISPTQSGYTLDSPESGGSDYTGYYTYGSATITAGNNPYYLVAKSGDSRYHYIKLSPNQTLADFDITVGTDLVNNGDGTFTVANGANPATVVQPVDWYNNYSSYQGLYTCGTPSSTCSEPRYITGTSAMKCTYMPGRITIAKERNNLSLVDYVTIDMGQWYNGYNTTYANYIYTCGDTSTVCTPANLRYIISKNNTKYNYAPNHFFGDSVEYVNDKFVVKNTIPLENATNMTALSTHHYSCINPGETECANPSYIYYYTGSGKMSYVSLIDSSIDTSEKILDAMLKKNTTNSLVKQNVDSWYELYLKDSIYESKLDDVIYCNDRDYSTQSGYTFDVTGWADNGGRMNKSLYFKNNPNPTTDLSCKNLTDRFSITNNDAKLTYKIALPTIAEMNLLNNTEARKTTFAYWTMSPFVFNEVNARVRFVGTSGGIDNITTTDLRNIRPMITVIAGTKYTDGDGSMTNPYIVDMD